MGQHEQQERTPLNETTRTMIYKATGFGEEALGYIGADRVIYKLRWDEGQPVGRVDESGRIYRQMQHGERELGLVTADGEVHSHGLFEGGLLGWVEPDGLVMRGGLIFQEEEVGRVEGPQAGAAAAALLLLFLPDDAEANKRMQR
ncbi:MAG: hypothetical protein R2867_25075 [Caldilineaceae bacterium]